MPELNAADTAGDEYKPPPGLDDLLVPSLLTPCVFYDADFLPDAQATSIFEELRDKVAWEKNERINRWVALYGDEGLDYRYRDMPSIDVIPWSDSIAQIKTLVEKWYLHRTGLTVSFNVCLLNFYEDGKQRIGYHYDREEIGRSTPIASVSLGAPRTFNIKSKIVPRGQDGPEKASLKLANGSMLLMENICQHLYVHELHNTLDADASRVNLTFRCKLDQTDGEIAHEKRLIVPSYLKEPPPAIADDEGIVVSGARQVFGLGHSFTIGDDIDSSAVAFLVNTQLGTEAFVAAEVAEVVEELEYDLLVVAKPWGLPGFVACYVCEWSTAESYDDHLLLEGLLKLRSALNILRYHYHFPLGDIRFSGQNDETTIGAIASSGNDDIEPAHVHEDKLLATPDDTLHKNQTTAARGDWALEDVPTCAVSKKADWANVSAVDLYEHTKAMLETKRFGIPSLECANSASVSKPSFRVSCNRIGTHSFNSAQAEREIGGALLEFYDVEAKMKDFDVHIGVELFGGWCVIGTQCNSRDLSLRHKLLYTNRVTLKCNLAYIMLRAADVKPGGTILDPFCGSGTVILEAAEWLKGELTGVGLELNRKAATGASANAKDKGFSECCTIHCLDPREMRKVCPDESVDAVVTNVPWGSSGGKCVDLEALYEVIFRTCWYVLKPGGRMVLLVLRGLQTMNLLRTLAGRWRTLCFQIIRTPNNMPCMVVVEKLPRDMMREALQRQLYDMSHYINLAPEMYNALHSADEVTGVEITDDQILGQATVS